MARIMNPKIPDELISAYFDGEVTPEERRQVEKWLERSPDLRQWLDDTSKLSALLHSFPRESVPADLSSNVQKQIESIVVRETRPVPQDRRSLRREWTAFGAGMMVTVASLFMLIAVRPIDFHLSRRASPESKKVIALNDPQGMNLDGRPSSPASTEMAVVNSNHLPVGSVSNEAWGLAAKDSSNQAVPSAAEATRTPDVSNELSDTTALAATVADAEEATLQPQPLDEFYLATTNGNVGVIEQRVLDPSLAVAAVELNAHDVERGMEKLESLFQQKQLKCLENGDSFNSAGSKAAKPVSVSTTPAKDPNGKALAVNEVGLFFVRAPGPQVAETLREAAKDSETFSGQLIPQLPFELPAEGSAGEVASSRSESDKKDADASDRFQFSNGQPKGFTSRPFFTKRWLAVKAESTPSFGEQIDLAEATCAVNSFALSNNISINNLTPERADLALKFTRDHYRIQSTPVGTIAGTGDEAEVKENSTSFDVSDKKSFEKTVVEGGKTDPVEPTFAYYATFRATRDNKQENGNPSQNSSPRQSAVAMPRSYQQNQDWSLKNGSALRNRSQSRAAGNGPQQVEAGQRVRMVIIVKKPDSEANP